MDLITKLTLSWAELGYAELGKVRQGEESAALAKREGGGREGDTTPEQPVSILGCLLQEHNCAHCSRSHSASQPSAEWDFTKKTTQQASILILLLTGRLSSGLLSDFTLDCTNHQEAKRSKTRGGVEKGRERKERREEDRRM